MKTLLSGALMCAFFVLSNISIFAQGSLTPPGAPAPTMKSLDEVEPRINIQRTLNPLPNDSNYHYIINTAGSYYLTSNLGVTKPNGIRITVAGVTIDLNGFQISRSSGSGGDGITIDAAANRCTIKNGTFSGFANGVNSNAGAKGGSFIELTATGCSAAGLQAGTGATIIGCRAHDNTGPYGIFASDGCVLERCSATNNTNASSVSAGIFVGAGCTLVACTSVSNTNSNGTLSFSTGSGIVTGEGCSLQNCIARSNTGDGIRVADRCAIANCTSSGNGGTTNGAAAGIDARNSCVISDCAADGNRGSGVFAGDFAIGGTVIKGSSASQNSGTGIFAGKNSEITYCTATNNVGFGITVYYASTVSHCFTGGNDGGISANDHALIESCLANNNSPDAGLYVTSFSIVRNCAFDFNGGSGTSGMAVTGSGNRIEENNITRSYIGMVVDGTGNIIAKNTVSQSSSINYQISANNKVGVIVAAPNSGAISGNSGGAGLGTTDPWANFSY